jgi:thioredoxin 1
MEVLFCSFITVLLFPALARAAETLPSLKMLSTPTCAVCTRMARTLDDLNESYAGKIVAEKVNLFEHPDIAKEYNVRYVPTLLFADESGSVFKQNVGYMPVEKVLETFKEAGIVIE